MKTSDMNLMAHNMNLTAHNFLSDKDLDAEVELTHEEKDPIQSIADAKDLVDSCKPKLHNIKVALGAKDDFYLKLSTAVVNRALGLLVSAVNEAQRGGISIYLSSSSFRSIIRSAIEVFKTIGTLDMTKQQRTYYKKNLTILKSINSTKDEIYTKVRPLYPEPSKNWIWWVLGILTILGIIIGAAIEGHWIVGGIIGLVVALMIIAQD